MDIFTGTPPTEWEVVTVDHTIPLSDDAACIVARAGCYSLAATNHSLHANAIPTSTFSNRPMSRPYC